MDNLRRFLMPATPYGNAAVSLFYLSLSGATAGIAYAYSVHTVFGQIYLFLSGANFTMSLLYAITIKRPTGLKSRPHGEESPEEKGENQKWQ